MRSIRILLWASAIFSAAILVGCGGGSQSSPPQADFNLSLSSQSVYVPMGAGSGSQQVTIQAVNGFTQAVTVSFSGLPAEVTTSPALPITINPGSNQTITLTAASGGTPGVQTVTVNAGSGMLNHTAAFAVSVAAPSYVYTVTGYPSEPPYDLVGYSVDANQGTLAQVPGLPFSQPSMPIDLAAASESGGEFVYVLVPDFSSQTVTLNGYKVDPATGTLNAVQTITYPPNTFQTYMVVDPSEKFLYVVQSPCLLAYTIDPGTGNLTQASCSAGSLGPNASFIVPPPGNFAYSISNTPAEPSDWSVYGVNQSDGSLGSPATYPANTGGVLYTDPQGHAVYVASGSYAPLSCGALSVWQIDPATGAPTKLNSTFSPLCIPMAMTFDPGDKFAYVSSELNEVNNTNGIYAGTIDSTTGNLTLVTGSPFASGMGVAFGAVEASQGKFLLELTSGNTAAQLVAFTIDPATGALSQVSGVQASMPSKYLYVYKMVAISPGH